MMCGLVMPKAKSSGGFSSPHAPKDCPWFWTITELPRRPVDRGYVASRVEAMAEFKRYWDAEIQVK
jgi:hypothetical protein